MHVNRADNFTPPPLVLKVRHSVILFVPAEDRPNIGCLLVSRYTHKKDWSHPHDPTRTHTSSVRAGVSGNGGPKVPVRLQAFQRHAMQACSFPLVAGTGIPIGCNINMQTLYAPCHCPCHCLADSSVMQVGAQILGTQAGESAVYG